MKSGRDLDMLSGEIKRRASQQINSLLNGLNCQIENAISFAISERIIPHMQGVVEAILKRQLESVSSMSRRPQNVESEEVMNAMWMKTICKIGTPVLVRT